MAEINKRISHNIRNEFVILASLMHSAANRKKYCNSIESKCFISPSNRIIFQGIKYISDNNLEYDHETMAVKLRDYNFDYGGMDKLIDIYEAFDENKNIENHIEILKADYFRINATTFLLNDLSDTIADPNTPYIDISRKIKYIQDEHNKIYNKSIIINANDHDDRLSFYNTINNYRNNKVFGSTGFEELDKHLNLGFAPGKISTIGARCLGANSNLNFLIKTDNISYSKSITIKQAYEQMYHINLHWKDTGWNKNSIKFIRSDVNNKINFTKIKNIIYSGIKDLYRVITESGKTLESTLEHIYFNENNEEKKLSELNIDDYILCIDWNKISPEKIKDIIYIGKGETYDIENEEIHNFFANGIKVHNSGCGKSITISNFAKNKLLMGEKILALPIEIGRTSFKQSLISNHGNILYDNLMPKNIKNISNDDYIKLKREIHNTYNELFGIDAEIESRMKKMSIEDAQKLSIEKGSNCFVIDKPITNDELYNYLMNDNYSWCFIDLYNKLIGYEPDQKIITQRLDELQEISKETSTHITIVSQINREIEKYTEKNSGGKRPKMHQLKHSGSIEEVSDIVFLLYRHKYYHPEISEDVIEICIEKQRQGIQNKTIAYEFEGHYHRLGKHTEDWSYKEMNKADKTIVNHPKPIIELGTK